MVRKEALPEICRSYLLTKVTSLQSTGRNIIKKELLTKFLEVVLKMLENFQEELCSGVRFCRSTNCSYQPCLCLKF